MSYQVLIIGGGPAGLAAALALGRAGKRVLLCDAGSPRNATAQHIHNFVTRDGTAPSEFRQIGRDQLKPYPSVDVQNVWVESISGTRGAFEVVMSSGTVQAQRILLCTGMIDEMLPIPGFQEAWGHSIFQCPYCHGWEVRGRRWGYLALSAGALTHFPINLRSWTDDVVVFTNGAFNVPDDQADQLRRAGIELQTGPIARLLHDDGQLKSIELTDGTHVPCEILYAHPPQHHVQLVQELELTLDESGSVQADSMTRQTSRPGIYAAGDLITRMQSAIFAAAAGAHAASVLNFELTAERVANPQSPTS